MQQQMKNSTTAVSNNIMHLTIGPWALEGIAEADWFVNKHNDPYDEPIVIANQTDKQST